MTSSDSKSGDEGTRRAPSSYENWQACRDALPLLGKAEIPIYSDVEFSLPETPGLGPYRLQHAFAVETHDPALILFVDQHARFDLPMKKTETSGFTGALLGDEIAALMSLTLGRRFMAGHPTRTLDLVVGKHEWIIMGDLDRPNFFRAPSPREIGQRAPVLPRAEVRLEARMDQLATFPNVPSAKATALVRAARLYRDALWIAEAEPELSWLLLVSALEVAAVNHQTETPSIDILRASKPALVQRLEAVDSALVEEVAHALSRELRATARFRDFVLHYLPAPPHERPPEETAWARLDWAPKPMKKSLEKIYGLRSLALHEGIPFPPPMSWPPFTADRTWRAPSERILGLAASSGGGAWVANDLPMSLHSFEYIARGALLKWWEAIAAYSSQSTPGAQ